jgi:hypothetical protein
MYYEHTKQLNERQIAYNDMLTEELRMIRELSERVNEPSEMVMPSLAFYK